MMPAMAPLEMPPSSLSVLVAGVVLTASVATATVAVVAGMAVDVSVAEVTEVAVSDGVVDVFVAVVEVVVVVVDWTYAVKIAAYFLQAVVSGTILK